MRRVRLLLAVLAAGALGSSATVLRAAAGRASTESVPPATTDPFGWKPFAQERSDRLEEGSLQVPLDFRDPSGPQADLYLVRHLADPAQRIGSLLVNPGGPGSSAVWLAISAESIYERDIVERFDIVAWDPRGTGLSTPRIDCIESSEYDRFFGAQDMTPTTPAEIDAARALQREFDEACIAKHRDVLQFVGTNASARDMDSIRRALGEETISYFGMSYGGELGGVWSTMFPTTVRAAVFDGAIAPGSSVDDTVLAQSVAFEGQLNQFLERCSANGDCAFHQNGNSAAAFDALMQRLDDHPLDGPRGRTNVDRAVATTAVVMSMYSSQDWPALAEALAAADSGDGSQLLDLHDRYYGRQADGGYDDLEEALHVISCMDTADRPTLAEEQATAEALHAAAPRLVPSAVAIPSCSLYPPPIDPLTTASAAGTGPIVVLGTTGDPATPLADARRMAAALSDGRLVVVSGDQHLAYESSGCARRIVSDYLVDPIGSAPPKESTCTDSG